ncbi:hypothetical protein C8J56DRAFT_990712 [Mycena floridula]|nr:hypothetical protein C8J56DRAFT_990712 [Mycena floridula]
MAPSALYSKLLSLSRSHAIPKDLEEILSIRAPDAIHGWGHNFLVSQNPVLQDRMDNTAFTAHLHNSGPYLESQRCEIHDIIVDEHQRKSSIRMSYFLTPMGSTETVEQELIWTIKFTEEEEVPGGIDGILIKESIEFIDAATGVRLGNIIREIHGEINKNVRGSFGIAIEPTK